MKKFVGLAAFTALSLTAGTASAVSTSINYIDLAPGTDLQSCLQQGDAALTATGLSLLSRTSSAAWAESHQADALFMVYCITERQIAVVSASAEQENRSGDMGTYIDQIIENFINPPGGGRK
jgi:hypothetical protein